MNMIPEAGADEEKGTHNIFRDGPAPKESPNFQKKVSNEVFDDKTMYSENIFVNDNSSKKKAFKFTLPTD